ncbi:hypothetical protein [Amycolatopsis solani]|uniref:hypothetical protein n=1 Tax=Amycolatopsis solani TaxID=3028615 RepID=UPI0025B0B170|nr:hypothetical protein [Amycolatopsis sp. MEP2-6]
MNDDGFGWVFIADRKGEQRELAKSSRLYPSAKKARRAIKRVQDAVPGAGIGRPFTVPESTFAFVPGVTPLTTREAPEPAGRDGKAR